MRMPAVESRLSPLEFVETLGDLYQSAHASPPAVSVAYRRFRLALSRKLATSSKVKLPELCRAASSHIGIAKENQVKLLWGEVLSSNKTMLDLVKRLGFTLIRQAEAQTFRVELQF